MYVRAYQPDDLAEVVGIFQRSVHEISVRDYSAAQISAWAPEHPDLNAGARRLSSGMVLVCEHQDGMAGFIRAQDDGLIDLLYIHPHHQRVGVANTLLKEILLWASAQGIRRLASDVSITARPFFENAGFHLAQSQLIVRRGVELQNFMMTREL